ncbi:MAG: alpha/beta hydrolase [Clostridia bacterium]|nr:alpha/beta hydrolase [Clostridia bacterium]
MTKYPVVLIHGMMLKDFRFYRAFGNVCGQLREMGVKAYVLNHDGVGTIAHNAAQIKRAIQSILKEQGVEKVNLIAHSKGGLDARYMISALGMEDQVASLTTLSTPHHGSKMSRTLLKMPDWMARFIAFWTNLVYRIFGDDAPDLLTVARELTDTYLLEFNESVLNSEKVLYQSYSSGICNRRMIAMFVPHKLSVYCEGGRTDGMVSVESSKWGTYRGEIGGEVNHLEMVSFYGNKKRKEQVASFYRGLVKELAEEGF